MDEIGTVEQALFVFAGNDRALPFYVRHGFSPRFVVLVRRPPELGIPDFGIFETPIGPGRPTLITRELAAPGSRRPEPS